MTKPRLRPTRHAHTLKTPAQATREMGRLYRQCLNDRLPADKMTRLVMVLREIRNGLLQEAMMAQGTGQNGARTINNIQIIAVPPTGHVIGQNGQLLQIDHDPLCIEPS